MRMTRIPKDADLILNKVSGAPGFWIDNVVVMASVPSIMQAMLDEVAPKLKIGVRMLSETVRADVREGDIGMQRGEIAKANPEAAIGSYPFFDPQHGANTRVNLALSRRKQGFESPRERQCNQILNPSPSVSVQQLSNKRLWTGMDGMQIGQHVRSVWPYHSDLGATLRLAHLCGIAGCAGVTWLRTRRRARALMDNG